jgi:hypothetical protein
MQTTKTSTVDFTLTNFDFNAREVELIHRQFSGERSQLITAIDDALRCWAMSGASNPKITFDYKLKAEVKDGQTVKRYQAYQSDHASVFFQKIAEPMEIAPGAALQDPSTVIRLYDLAFAASRKTLPAFSIASYFSLREVVARIAPHASAVDVTGDYVRIFFRDGEEPYAMMLRANGFEQLSQLVDQLNTQQVQ